MPSKEHEALVEKVAKAINGPFRPMPEGSPYTLDQLRDIRWQQINEAERKLCLAGAEAAISTISAAIAEADTAMLQAAQDTWLADPCRKSSTLWRAMLAASALGEQSE